MFKLTLALGALVFASPGAAQQSNDELAVQATDPTATLMTSRWASPMLSANCGQLVSSMENQDSAEIV